ncbi:DUF6663 family protein [Halobellus ruber]|uniref:Uncharacterized protein n=1 Tax=Halobellus ruber TaxID=2761102 RepID=A0A7J9SKH1_9EURY|nr:DUF6663 family protein [Halobellus ruber]MBB6646497.1 hypothetical protein [Halobellus ruber]
MTGSDPTTEGRYRVLGRPRDPAELLLVTVDGGTDPGGGPDAGESDAAFEPVYVDTTGYEGDLAATVDGLHAGMLVDATLVWRDGTPRFRELDVVADTAFEFHDGVTGIFEAAKNAWMVAEADNEGMNARVTRNTDGEPNGALYVFAKQSGARDLFEEFRTGVTPLSPLVTRVDEAESVPPEADQPRATFVLRPADEPFLVVYVAFRRDGVLAETMRTTYGDGSIVG